MSMKIDGKILVTGGAGYVGSHVILALRNAGYDAIVVDNLSTGSRESVPDGVPFYQGEVGDADLIGLILDEHTVDAAIHLAASSSVPAAIEDPLATYQNNCGQSRSFFTALADTNVRSVVFSSSAAVYGPTESGVFSEESAKDPANPYGRSKVMCEWMLEDLCRSSEMEHVSLRYFNVAGADGDGRAGQSTPGAGSLIKVASQAALGKKAEMMIFGSDYDTEDGTCIRDFVHVSDVAEAHVAALSYLRDGGSSVALNCGCGKGYSVKEVIEAVRRISDREFSVSNLPRRAGDLPIAIADTARIEKLLGWSAGRSDLMMIVESALRWENRIADVQPQEDGIEKTANGSSS